MEMRYSTHICLRNMSYSVYTDLPEPMRFAAEFSMRNSGKSLFEYVTLYVVVVTRLPMKVPKMSTKNYFASFLRAMMQFYIHP